MSTYDRFSRCCDECDVPEGVKSAATIALPSGRTMLLCGHHLDIHAVALLKMGAVILDDREVMEGA